MCDNAGDTYSSTIEYVPDQLETQEMCNKAVEKCPSAFDSVLDQHKTQEMCDKIVSDNLFKFKYCHNRCKTQEICNKTVDDFLPELQFVPDWFVISEMIKKLLTVLYADDSVLYFNEDSGDAVFFVRKWVFLL